MSRFTQSILSANEVEGYLGTGMVHSWESEWLRHITFNQAFAHSWKYDLIRLDTFQISITFACELQAGSVLL